MIQDALERAPVIIACLANESEERALLAREETEMAANEKADGPTFIDYTKGGRPVGGYKELLAQESEQPVVPVADTNVTNGAAATLTETGTTIED